MIQLLDVLRYVVMDLIMAVTNVMMVISTTEMDAQLLAL